MFRSRRSAAAFLLGVIVGSTSCVIQPVNDAPPAVHVAYGQQYGTEQCARNTRPFTTLDEPTPTPKPTEVPNGPGSGGGGTGGGL